jgi:hypothetical protein
VALVFIGWCGFPVRCRLIFSRAKISSSKHASDSPPSRGRARLQPLREPNKSTFGPFYRVGGGLAIHFRGEEQTRITRIVANEKFAQFAKLASFFGSSAAERILDLAARRGYDTGTMFEIIKGQLTTVAEKLTHLRRFL